MPKGASPSDSDVCMEFRDELQRIISCITDASFFFYRTDKSGEELLLSPAACIAGIVELELRATHQFRLKTVNGVKEPSTTKYLYSLVERRTEIMRFDYDETQDLWAHVHILRRGKLGGRTLSKVHIPTGRITLERVGRLLHRDFKVPYLPDEATAEKILDKCEEKHRKRRSGRDL
jgi:hypothetical protein